MRRLRAPLWFHVLVAVAGAVLLRASFATPDVSHPFAGGGGEVHVAFWWWIIPVAEAIWAGIQAVGQLTLQVLHWLYLGLSATVTTIGNGLVGLGKTLKTAFLKSWDFLRATYDHVLKPAWEKFWKFFDKVQRWLKDTLAPVFKFLRAVRDEILCFYKTWIRPILDVIDATRGILRVLEALHIEWAAKLDAQLGAIEDWVNRQFDRVLSKVNEAIGIVNRVVTADGLFQRVALIRSLERDIVYAGRALANARLKPLTAAEKADTRKRLTPPTIEVVARDTKEYFETGGGPSAPLIDELAADVRLLLRAQ